MVFQMAQSIYFERIFDLPKIKSAEIHPSNLFSLDIEYLIYKSTLFKQDSEY